jgi:membrane-associated phospholipid phosphatase
MRAVTTSPSPVHHPLLDDHRRAALYGTLLLIALIFMLVGVGKHPTTAAPETTITAIGATDDSVYDSIVPRRTDVLTTVFKAFDVTGKGVVTIPLRIALVAILLVRRRWPAAVAFMIAWTASEIAIEVLKGYFQRGRPPLPLVETVGFSFPSGHATAGAAIAVAVVFAFLKPGHRRRVWTLLAVIFAFAMAFSRVYLGAHWLSDVVTGVLLGSVCAIGGFALVDEVQHRRHRPDTTEAVDQPVTG